MEPNPKIESTNIKRTGVCMGIGFFYKYLGQELIRKKAIPLF